MKYKKPKSILKKESQKQFWKIFLIESSLFLFTSLISILGAFQIEKLASSKKVYLPTTSLQDFLTSFLIIMVFVLLLVSYKKANKFKEIIYKGFFLITCLWGGMTILDLFLPVFGALAIMGVLLFLWIKKPNILIHDILMILGLAGVTSFLGLSFSSAVIVAILSIFSVYDFIAVYKTKHMVAMAKEMVEKKVIMGFIIPREIKYFNFGFENIKTGGNFLILGGGDIVFPSLLAVSVVPTSILKSLVIIIFSLIGSYFSYWLFTRQKNKEPIPALPPIALMSIFGYLLTLLW